MVGHRRFTLIYLVTKDISRAFLEDVVVVVGFILVVSEAGTGRHEIPAPYIFQGGLFFLVRERKGSRQCRGYDQKRQVSAVGVAASP